MLCHDADPQAGSVCGFVGEYRAKHWRAPAVGLAEARAKNIPVINIGGVQNPSANVEAQYFGDPADLTAALDKYMFAHLPPHPQIAEFTSKIEYDEQLRDAGFLTGSQEFPPTRSCIRPLSIRSMISARASTSSFSKPI